VISSFSIPSLAQEVIVVKFDHILEILKNDTDKVLVLNFWATWCAPCVKELPAFEAINGKEEIEVILVSLDFEDQVKKVRKFIEKREIKSKVILLDEIDYNSWIDRVDNTWSGAIPATVIIAPHATRKKFIEGELYSDELDKVLQQFL